MIFSNKRYLVLSFAIFVGMLIPLSYVAEYLFFEPYFTFNIASYNLFGFVLIVAVSALTGLIISMAVYRIIMLKSSKKKIGTSFIGSFIGASAGACSCGSIGFAVISIFGAVGGVATSFLANYEILLRLVSIAILIGTYFYMVRGLTTECKINFNERISEENK